MDDAFNRILEYSYYVVGSCSRRKKRRWIGAVLDDDRLCAVIKEAVRASRERDSAHNFQEYEFFLTEMLFTTKVY